MRQPTPLMDYAKTHRLDGSPESSAPSSPDQSWKVAEIKAWLDAELIDYPSGATKAELLTLVNYPPPLPE